MKTIILCSITLFAVLTVAKYEGIERSKCNDRPEKHMYKPFDGCYIMTGDFTYWEYVSGYGFLFESEAS